MFADIQDAFLLVNQTKLVLVEQPSWWRPEEVQNLAPNFQSVLLVNVMLRPSGLSF